MIIRQFLQGSETSNFLLNAENKLSLSVFLSQTKKIVWINSVSQP